MPRPTETGTQAGRSRARPPKPADVIVSPGSIVKSIKEAVTTGGDIARFSWQVVRALPDLRHYPTEVFHQ
ncbi:hypothetical protein FHU38_005177, partial [Saccharomonospora amisosensis]|nr:hypothetical protein [Saccharomonospora amisosensis]